MMITPSDSSRFCLFLIGKIDDKINTLFVEVLRIISWIIRIFYYASEQKQFAWGLCTEFSHDFRFAEVNHANEQRFIISDNRIIKIELNIISVNIQVLPLEI